MSYHNEPRVDGVSADPTTPNRAYEIGWNDGFEEGRRTGYREGENERIALATANSDLRSELRVLKGEYRSLTAKVRTLVEAVQ